jgi:hypothetical protein
MVKQNKVGPQVQMRSCGAMTTDKTKPINQRREERIAMK